jgi:ATP-dependent protease ClpP protease subunit
MPHKFKIRAKNDSATIYVYDEIGGWGVSSKDFASQMVDIGSVKNINVRINSPGGDVFAGLAMYNLLKDHSAEVTVDVDGWAASAASVVAMAGDQINMAANAFMLVHAPWTIHGGNSEDFRKVADRLEAVESSLVDTYANRRGIDRQVIADWVAEETLFSADGAVEAGMADAVTGESAIAASADFSGYRFLPHSMRGLKPQPVTGKDIISIAASQRKRQLTLNRSRR